MLLSSPEPDLSGWRVQSVKAVAVSLVTPVTPFCEAGTYNEQFRLAYRHRARYAGKAAQVQSLDPDRPRQGNENPFGRIE
jgi:hypothetical protein